MNENEILRSIDQYEILCELGRGGTSVVYLVTDRADGRNYAMKTLREDCGNKPEEYEQKAEHLRAEAEVLKALCANGLESEVLKEICRDEQDTAFSHSGIPAFRECVCDENGDFAGFVMEYVEGRSLQQILEDGKCYTVRETAEAGLQLCGIMEQLHGQEPPMIFRDLKPANILVRPGGEFVLVDYGAVRKLRKSAATDTMRLGTDGYAAPEQYAVRRLGTVRREDRHLRHRSGPASYDHRTPAAGDRVEAAARDFGFKRGKPAIRRDGQNIASLLHDRAIYAIFLLQGIGKSAEGGARKLRERRDSEKKALGNCWV